MVIRFFLSPVRGGMAIGNTEVGQEAIWAQRPMIQGNLGLLIRRRSVDLEKSGRIKCAQLSRHYVVLWRACQLCLFAVSLRREGGEGHGTVDY